MKFSTMLLSLTSVIACSLAARGFQLQSRTVQSLAVCKSDFAWASNSRNESPCQVVAELDALCNNNEWTIPAINASVVYTVPTPATATVGSTVSACTCSWASYNLISACQACQHFPEQISNWSPYIINCGGQTTPDTFFPRSLTIPQGTLIPFWATINPTTWLNGERFNPAQAQNISKQGNPDFSAVPPPASKSTPIGAIVGGVIGGIIVLLAAILVGICLIRRARFNKSQALSNGGPSLMHSTNHTHSRSQSDFSTNSNKLSTPMGYTSFSSILSRPPTSPTIRTQGTSSIRSFPFFSSRGSTVYSPPSMQQQLSPSVGHQSPPSMRHQSPPSVRQQSPSPVPTHRDETAVEPFVLLPNSNPDRKQANGAYPTYDSPTAPPPTSVRMEVRPTTPTQGGRTRYNPPAYTEKTKASVQAGGASSPHHRPPQTGGHAHAKKGSADTQHSITSSRSGAGGGVTRIGGNPTTASMVNQLTPVRAAMIPQFNTHVAASMNANAVPTGHGRQLSGNTTSDTSMDGKRRPTDTDDSFSARDLA